MTDAQVERTEALEGLDLPAYYTNLGTLREAIAAASQEALTPAETPTAETSTPETSVPPATATPAA